MSSYNSIEVVKLGKMAENSYDQLDDLFAQFRLHLLEIRQCNPETVESMKAILSQLEDCVERLVIDSIKLKSLEEKSEKTTRPKDKSPGTAKPKKPTPAD